MLNSLFDWDKPRPMPSDEAVEHLVTVCGQGEMMVVRSLLEGAEIPYLIRERAPSSLIIGGAMYGADVYVPASAYEAAVALVAGPSDAGPSDADTETEAEDS